MIAEQIYLSKITVLLLIVVAVVAFLAGAYVRPLAGAAPFGLPQVADSVGRFTLVVSPLVKNEKFLLDTQTGKIWQLVKAGEQPDKPFVCQHMDRVEDLSAHPNNKVGKDKNAKEKLFTSNASAPGDVTVEVLTSGKISKQTVHAGRISQLSITAPNRTNL